LLNAKKGSPKERKRLSKGEERVGRPEDVVIKNENMGTSWLRAVICREQVKT